MKGIAFLDMDGTILSRRTVDVLCEALEKLDELRELDKRSQRMREFEISQEIARLLSGSRKEKLEELFDAIPLNKNAENFIRFLKNHGFKTVLVTDSYQFLAKRLAEKLGMDLAYGNAVEFKDDIFTGKLLMKYPCMKIPGCKEYSLCKRRVLLEVKRKFKGVTLAIGDGGSDICMVEAADVGIAYTPKSERLMDVAKFTVSNFLELEKILSQMLGSNYRRSGY
ncbi:MAG: HAD family hydrolase [Candidatus Bathycorpusculaceae bacterium]